MSIRPIDLQVTIPKSAELNKSNLNDNNRPDLQQRHFSEQFQKQIDLNQQSVIKSEKSEKNAIKDEERRKNKQGNKKESKKDENKDLDDKKKQPTARTSGLDIKI